MDLLDLVFLPEEPELFSIENDDLLIPDFKLKCIEVFLDF